MNGYADAIPRAPVNPGPQSETELVNFPILEMQRIDMRTEQIANRFCNSIIEAVEGEHVDQRIDWFVSRGISIWTTVFSFIDQFTMDIKMMLSYYQSLSDSMYWNLSTIAKLG